MPPITITRPLYIFTSVNRVAKYYHQTVILCSIRQVDRGLIDRRNTHVECIYAPMCSLIERTSTNSHSWNLTSLVSTSIGSSAKGGTMPHSSET